MAVMNYIGLLFSEDIFGFGSDTYVYPNKLMKPVWDTSPIPTIRTLSYGYVGAAGKSIGTETMETAIVTAGRYQKYAGQ
ncbi:MAG: hypothetical protein CM1200mP18_13780 [Gammaproteobacteria bacterium]|nr:MAG: hypothetical protein CM1200mP18_13780 [Gammaproteobacteria bacterium]